MLPMICVINTSLIADTERITGNVKERRQAVVKLAKSGKSAIPELEKSLTDPSPLVRRPAVRQLIKIGVPAKKVLIKAMKDNNDPVVRKAAVQALIAMSKTPPADILVSALKDTDEEVRLVAAEALAAAGPENTEIAKLLKAAYHDPSMKVRAVATGMSCFYREVVPFRERPDIVDHVTRIKIAEKVAIPDSGWRIKSDPEENGHGKRWYGFDFNDSGWNVLKTKSPMPKGVTWYRRTFQLPAKPADVIASELLLPSAQIPVFIWINSGYAGQNDISSAEQHGEFALDVSGRLRWGRTNQITIRTINSGKTKFIPHRISLDALELH